MRRLVFGGLQPLWRWLRTPWLLFLGSGMGLALAIAARVLPQLPGQLLDEPATAARWMQEVSINYGVWGNLWLALGLFDVLHSPLLQITLAICIPALGAQLTDEIAAVRQRARIHRHLSQASPVNAGEVIALPVTQAQRRRFGVEQPPETVINALNHAMTTPGVLTNSLRVPLRPAESDDLREGKLDAEPDTEVRLTAIRAPRITRLRPLLALGLLVALGSLWSALVWGWQIAAPPLAPGTTYRAIGYALELEYKPSISPTVPSLLQVDFDEQQYTLPVDRAQRQRLGIATLSLDPIFPALWIATADGAAQLSLPGRGERVPAVGLVFTGDTTEESVLLPALGAGLRVIQRSLPDPGFVLELYRSDEVQPVYRAELPPNGRVLIPLARTNLELIVTTLPGLVVNVRYLPNLWLAWVGLALALVGAAAHFFPTGWLAVQVAPWPVNRTVVVLQGSDARWIDELEQHLYTTHDEDVRPLATQDA